VIDAAVTTDHGAEMASKQIERNKKKREDSWTRMPCHSAFTLLVTQTRMPSGVNEDLINLNLFIFKIVFHV